MKKHLLTLFLAFTALVGYAQVTLSGRVVDEKGETMPSVNVIVKKNGVMKANGQTDLDGVYRINNIDPGTYDVEFSSVGYSTQRQEKVPLTSGVITVNATLAEDAKLLGAVVVTEYKVPIVKVDQTSQGRAFTAEEMRTMPVRDVNGIVSMSAGVSSQQGETPTIKGARSSGTDYYIDGIRVRGAQVPVNEIEQLQVITSGLEAKYGDVTGGVIPITLKGSSTKFKGYAEVESSQFLDAFGYNFANLSFSGPLLQRTKTDKTGTKYKENVIGFRLAGQLRTDKDANPSAIPVYRVKEDVLKQIEANPIAVIGGGTRVAAAELLTRDNFDALKINPGNERKRYDITTKFDAKLGKGMDATLTGTYYHIDDQFSPTDWQVFNSFYNPSSIVDRYRANFRFRHKIGSGAEAATTRTAGLSVENAQYTLQAGYEKGFTRQNDPRHGNNAFNYGYVGQFDYKWTPVFAPDTTGGLSHQGFRQELINYKRAEFNPVLANYNNGLEVDASGNNLNVFNGLYNRNNLANVWNFHQNVGAVYNTISKTAQDIVIGQATLSFDIVPNGSKEKAHNIEVGFLYEQRTDRAYTLRPFSLWNLAERLQNGNINGFGVDTTVRVGDTIINGQTYPVYAPLKNKDIENETDIQFYKRYRERSGLASLSFGNVNNLLPDQMSLDMFTARELNDQNLVSYYGFDYLGNMLGSNVTFKDFFTARGADGVRTFPVAPVSPLYVAGYIQDKFRYNDIIFSVGLRVDRFDANTKVMKDPYSLYEVMTAKDYYQNVLKTEKPSNIGDDYRVYLTTNTLGKTNYNYKESDIRAYRVGDQWYSAKGQPTDPVLLLGEGTQTFAKYYNDTFPQIKQLGFDPEISFTDYKPQTNVMPRLGFSFPIGEKGKEKANFFAHYDVLVARPPSNNIVTALNYYYFDDPGRTPENNANLKPERTIDYEVGFQQELTSYSGIKIAAYYREMRDMLQLRYYKYLPAPLKINEYASQGNIDFGTVKGFTFQYDLRRINHFQGQINYTLQFADGTGSDPTSQRSLNRRGNIRTLSPVDYDERHRIAVTADYRYDEGIYKGPRLFGLDLFKRAGANVQVMAVSGRPYTKRRQPQPFDASQIDGDINGARKPWTFNIDARFDKTVSLSKDAKKPLDLNIYLRIQNLLDTRNVTNVYTATGSPEDDGYLASARGQSELANTLASRPNDFAAYQFSYLMRMLNPGNFFFPRRISVGCAFEF